MVVVVGALVLALVLLVAAVAVGREAARMRVEPPEAVFDVEQAVAWVIRHCPDDVAAELTVDDVRRIIDLQIEYFRRTGVSRNGRSAHPEGSVVVGGSETVGFIIERAASGGLTYTPRQVHAVVETQIAYLRAVGALGPPAGPDDRSGEGGRTR